MSRFELRRPSMLKPNPHNIRIYGIETIDDDFIEDVRSNGVLVPIVIKEDGVIVSGHRRCVAAIKVGLTEVMCSVRAPYATIPDEILDLISYNKQREKTVSQHMGEYDAVEWAERKLAEGRQKATRAKPGERADERADQMVSTLDKGYARAKIADRIGMSQGSMYRARVVWEKAKKGDALAQKLIQELDAGDTTITTAYKAIHEPRQPVVEPIVVVHEEELEEEPTIVPIADPTPTPESFVHVSANSGNNEWYTPSNIIEAARNTMGSIDVDPASSVKANEVVNAETFYTVDDNGLSQEWVGNVWMNPPYSQPAISKFSETLVSKIESGEIVQATVLVNNATETAWLQRMLACMDSICFLKGRVRFIDPTGAPTGQPLQGQVVLYFGENSDMFETEFESLGVIYNVSHR